MEKVINAIYKRNLDHNYMILDCEDSNNYQVRMISENSIKGLIGCSLKIDEGEYVLCYDATSVQPLSRLYEKKQIEYDSLEKILSGIVRGFRNISEYMLDENSLVLDPKFLFADVESEQIFLLFYPFYEKNFKDSFKDLSEFILERINHMDNRAVMLAYSFFKLVKSGAFTISDIEELELEKTATEDIPNSPIVNNEIEYNDEYDIWEELDQKEKTKNRNEGKTLFSKIAGLFRSRQEDNNNPDNEIIIKKEISDCTTDIYDFPQTEQKDYGKTVLLSMEKESGHEKYLSTSYFGKEQRYELKNLPLTIGKVPNCVDIVLDDSSVSRMHAQLLEKDNIIFIKDCGSTNGTRVNGVMVSPNDEMPLQPDDEISIGKVKMIFN